MTTTLYGLTASQVERLRRVLDEVDANPRDIPRNRFPRQYGNSVLVGILTDAIAATTGLATKPKVGTLNVYEYSSTGVTDTGFDQKIYSFAPQSATTDRWTIAELDSFQGKWVLTTQFCS